MYDYAGADHWQRTTVFRLARWKNGLAFKNINFSKDGRPVIKIAELKAGITDQTKFTDGKYDKSVFIQKGDMLFSWSGNPDTSIDVFRWDGPEGWLNQHIYKVTPYDEVEEEFLFFLLRFLRPRFAEIARNKQTTGLGHVTLQDFKNMLVGLPTRHEQNAIISIVSPLQNKIELNRQTNETLEALARALFKDWFVDFGPTRTKAEGGAPYLAPELWALFPDALDDEDKPVGWEISKLGEVIEILDSKRVPLSSRERDKRKGSYPYHGATGVMDHIDDYLFDGIHVLVGEDGSVKTDDGHPFVQYVWGRFWVNNHAHVLQGKGISNEHLLCYLQQIEIGPYVTGAVQPKLNQRNLRAIPFVKAKAQESTAFAKILDPLFQSVRANCEESRTLAQTRDLLLPKLMSGEIRLRDAEREVEAVL